MPWAKLVVPSRGSTIHRCSAEVSARCDSSPRMAWSGKELRHLDHFEKLMVARRLRPTVLQPFWHVTGFALGAATALLGERAAMACTVAVEEVIDEHYGGQLETLGEDEAELKTTLEEFRADERKHRETGLKHGAEAAPAYEVLRAAIKSGSRLAIWLSERI